MTVDPEKLHIHGSDCLEAMDLLYAYLNGELKEKVTLNKMEHHLSHCESCFSRAEMERELNKRLKESDTDETPESLQNRLRDLMNSL